MSEPRCAGVEVSLGTLKSRSAPSNQNSWNESHLGHRPRLLLEQVQRHPPLLERQDVSKQRPALPGKHRSINTRPLTDSSDSTSS